MLEIAKKTYAFDLPMGKVEIGNRNKDTCEPHIYLPRWDGECYVAVGADLAGAGVSVKDGKVSWEVQDRLLRVRELPVSKQMDGGGVGFDIVLKKLPKTNKFLFSIDTQNLIWDYQPPLTTQEKERGDIRPENIVGSYAVYHSTKGGMNDSRGKDYKAGKAFHVFRPPVEDANGDTIWAVMSLENRRLVLTVDWDWLQSARYPVTIDPDFGFKGEPETSSAFANFVVGTAYSCPDEGTVESITGYVGEELVPTLGRCVIYRDSDDSRIDYTAQVETAGPQWEVMAASLGGSLSASAYKLGVWAHGSSPLVFYYDSGAMGFYDAETYHATNPPPATLDPSDFADHRYAIYCTYNIEGWSHKINGVSSPAEVNTVEAAAIAKVDMVPA